MKGVKGVKGKLLRTIQSMKPISFLNQDRILQAFASDGYVDSWPTTTNLNDPFQFPELQSRLLDVSDLMTGLEDESVEASDEDDNKENNDLLTPKEGFHIKTYTEIDNGVQSPLSEIDISSFRRPEINAGSLFDPKLLAAFQQAVMDYHRMYEEERKRVMHEQNLEKNEDEPPLKSRRIESEKESEDENPLSSFPEKCPPGGVSTVILYTTSLRGIRKTFEDCNSIRFLLESFKVLFFERDVSIHREFKEELWQILGGKFLPPKLFINGRFIGGAEEVLNLHEQGNLKTLFQGLPMDVSNGPCEGCGGIRFVLCFNCNGSRKIISINGRDSEECPDCNENGLILCPFCC